MEMTRNIIILNNLNSRDIEQAIIILKKNSGKKFVPEPDIVSEAEEIIDKFIAAKRKQSRRIRKVRSVLVLLPAAAFIGLFMFLIFKFI